MQPVGAILVGLLSQRIGSRYSLLLSSICLCVSALVFYSAKNSTMLLIAQAISAISSVQGPIITYIAEITQHQFRSTIMATTNFSATLGALFSVTISTFLNWRTIAAVNFVFSFIGVVAMFFVPNSPYWFASTMNHLLAFIFVCFGIYF